MKSIFCLLTLSLLLMGCIDGNHVIEDTICNTNVKNHSSRNIFVQFYMNNNDVISRVSVLKNEESYPYGQSGYYYTFDYSNPNEQIKKIIIIDTDTHKILTRIDDVDEVFKLDHADDNYDMRARFEYYVFDITDALFKD